MPSTSKKSLQDSVTVASFCGLARLYNLEGLNLHATDHAAVSQTFQNVSPGRLGGFGFAGTARTVAPVAGKFTSFPATVRVEKEGDSFRCWTERVKQDVKIWNVQSL
jgi:hypothetical protein